MMIIIIVMIPLVVARVIIVISFEKFEIAQKTRINVS